MVVMAIPFFSNLYCKECLRLVKYVIKRILILIPVAFIISIMLFAIVQIMPGDPVRSMLPTTLKAEQYDAAYEAMYIRLGLDKSLPEQYFIWMGNIFKGDFGYSSMFNRPVADAISEPLKNTVILNIGVNILYLLIAIPVGIMCATKRNSLFDNGWQVFSLITYSMPSFFIAISLIYVFAINLGWLPMGGMPNTAFTDGWDLVVEWARTLALPTLTLTIVSLAGAIRYVRNAMVEALSQDYIRTARAKGLSEKVVIYSHAFRNALIPVSFVIVSTLFALFAGAAITETIFQYNGIGKLMISAVFQRDNQMITTMNLFFATISIVSVLIADIVYGLVDPRIKLS